MTKADDAAAYLWRAHRERRAFENLPDPLAPATIDEAYDAQEAFHRLAIPALGRIAGVKIATTTKVMQALMGIDHPCGGAIFASRVFPSPAELDLSAYV
ncbi:MAG: hydratase, partial [Beijerinckiaceae bacterium]